MLSMHFGFGPHFKARLINTYEAVGGRYDSRIEYLSGVHNTIYTKPKMYKFINNQILIIYVS